MAGRPKKKPEYNPELQFNHFLQELRDAYEEADSLRSLADELNISLLKLRKLLITANVFTSDICTEINDLHQSGKKIPEIMKLTDFPLMVFPVEAEPALVESYMSCISPHLDLSLLHYKAP